MIDFNWDQEFTQAKRKLILTESDNVQNKKSADTFTFNNQCTWVPVEYNYEGDFLLALLEVTSSEVIIKFLKVSSCIQMAKAEWIGFCCWH